MATKTPDDSYTVVDELADVADTLTEIRSHDLLAVDCEGVNLGRAGELTVLTVATPIKSFIFDILKLGKQVFDDGLRDILEDKTKEKLMFDCRGDADSLCHQFKVRLSGVLDLQLLEVMIRKKTPSSSASRASGSKRSIPTDDVESVYGLLRCVELYMADKKIIDKKKRGIALLECGKYVWKIRPISDILKSYCCVDTSGLFSLYEKLKGGGDVLPRLRIASDRYADFFRSKPVRTYGLFENHNLLPLYIIPDEGSASLPYSSTKCVGCHRLFLRDEFSKTQLRKGEQKCRVCKMAKLRADGQKNREDNLRRDETIYPSSRYYFSDEDWWTNTYDDDYYDSHYCYNNWDTDGDDDYYDSLYGDTYGDTYDDDYYDGHYGDTYGDTYDDDYYDNHYSDTYGDTYGDDDYYDSHHGDTYRGNYDDDYYDSHYGDTYGDTYDDDYYDSHYGDTYGDTDDDDDYYDSHYGDTYGETDGDDDYYDSHYGDTYGDTDCDDDYYDSHYGDTYGDTDGDDDNYDSHYGDTYGDNDGDDDYYDSHYGDTFGNTDGDDDNYDSHSADTYGDNDGDDDYYDSHYGDTYGDTDCDDDYYDSHYGDTYGDTDCDDDYYDSHYGDTYGDTDGADDY